MSMPQTTLGGFSVSFNNTDEFHDLKNEIFTNHTYFHDFETDSPHIIDAGAHIGIATLYFKKQFPNSKIIAIEPHPVSFALLKENVEQNHFEEITLVQAALVGVNNHLNSIDASESSVAFYSDASDEWLISSSLSPGAWNGKQADMRSIKVPANKLSNILQTVGWQKVDLLKLDVEGAERHIITDLISSGMISKIGLIDVEVHALSGKSLATFIEMLSKQGFEPDEQPPGRELRSHYPVLKMMHFSRTTSV